MQLFGDTPTSKTVTLDLRNGIDLGRVEQGQLSGFSPDGRFLAVTTRGTFVSVGPIRLWDLHVSKELAPVAKDWKRLGSICFSPDGKLIAAHDKKEGIGVWDALTGKQIMGFHPPTIFGNWVSFWFSPDSGALIYEHYGKNFPNDQIFNVRNVGATRDRTSFIGEPYLMQFSDTNKFATCLTVRGQRDRILLWEWKPDQPLNLLKDYRIAADHVAVSKELTEFVTANGDRVRVFQMADGQERMAFTDPDKVTHIQTIEYGADGKQLVVSSGGGSQLNWSTRSTVWNISGKRARQIGEFANEPATSIDGRWVAGARSETDVALLEAETGKTAGALTRKGDRSVTEFHRYNNMKIYPAVEFSANNRLAILRGLVSEDAKPFVRIHQLDPLRELGVIESCWQAQFGPDGLSLIGIGADDKLLHWKIRPVEKAKQ